MKQVLAWISGARWRLSLSHCFEGLLIQIPVGLLVNFRIGALAVVVWYWSRKKIEAELKTLGREEFDAYQSHAYSWAIGWFPWQWDGYKILDVVLPAVSSLLIAYFFSFYHGLLTL
jgi:hypothetical protein